MAPAIIAAIAAGAGIAGEIINYVSAQDEKEAAKEEAEKASAWASNLKAEIQKRNAANKGLYGSEADVKNYINAARNYDQESLYNEFYDLDGDGKADTEKFDFGQSAEDYYNRNSDRIIGDVMRKAQGVAAGQGMGRSYDGANAMVQAAIDKDEQLWNDANNQYNQARNQAYSEWNGYLAQKNNQYNAIVGAMQGDLAASRNLASMFQTNSQNEFEDLMNAEIAGQNARQGAANSAWNAGNYTVDIGGILSGAAGFANGVSQGADM